MIPEKTKLKRCPFCRSKKVNLVRVRNVEDEEVSYLYCVLCSKCYATGPTFALDKETYRLDSDIIALELEEKVVNAWNERPKSKKRKGE